MNRRAIAAIARKDATDIVLNKATLVGLLSPILLTFVWLLISRIIGGTTTNVLIYNPGNSNIARVVTGAIPNVKVTEAASAEEVSRAFANSNGKTTYAGGLVIPANLESVIGAGQRPTITLYLDGANVNPQTEAFVQAAITNYARTLAMPQPPVEVITSVINRKPAVSTAVELGQFYASLTLLLSLIVGMTFMPQLLIEEKEKKTLRMLMVAPASFTDVLLGKLMVVLVYQLALTGLMLAIQGTFRGQVGWVVVYMVLGAIFSLSLGLLFSTVFDTVGAASSAEGIVLTIFILAGIFVGPLGSMMAANSPVSYVVRALPTYYIAEGVYKATSSSGTLSSNLLDAGVVLGSSIIALVVAVAVLRRKASQEALF